MRDLGMREFTSSHGFKGFKKFKGFNKFTWFTVHRSVDANVELLNLMNL
jgi:hypothetical protein